MSETTEPKPGTQTSAFALAVVSALAPILLLTLIIVGLIFVQDERARDLLVNALYVVVAGVIGGAAVGYKYVDRRGDVSVAKVEAQSARESQPAPIVIAGQAVEVASAVSTGLKAVKRATKKAPK